MPRKRIENKKVRRLTPREIDFLVLGTVLWDMEQEGKFRGELAYDKKKGLDYRKEQEKLRGTYLSLAIIVEGGE
jgi:hypothetical protein